jgi:hypothetical protein
VAKNLAPETAALDAEKMANDLLNAATAEFPPQLRAGSYYSKKLEDIAAGKELLALDRETQAVVVRVALGRAEELEKKAVEFRSTLENPDESPFREPGWYAIRNPAWVLEETLRALLRCALPLREDDLVTSCPVASRRIRRR